MCPFNDRAQKCAATEIRRAGNCIRVCHETLSKAFSEGGWEREVNMDCSRARYRRLYGVWSYQKTQSCMHPTLQYITLTNTHTHLKRLGRAAEWFVCVVGAVDWSHGGSNCLMVGFMETLYNACDSLFSACQEEGICDTTMTGTLLQPHALMHPPFTAPEGEMSEGGADLFAC